MLQLWDAAKARRSHDLLKKLLLTVLTPLFSTEGPPLDQLEILGTLSAQYSLLPENPWENNPCYSQVYARFVRALCFSDFESEGLSNYHLSLADQSLILFPTNDLSNVEEVHLRRSRLHCSIRQELFQASLFIAIFFIPSQ